jgi:hypothetical protein
MEELYSVYDPQTGDWEVGTKEEMKELFESWKKDLTVFENEPEKLHLLKVVKTATAGVDESAKKCSPIGGNIVNSI